MRDTIPCTSDEWSVMVDMFFYRDPEEVEKQQKEADAKAALLAGNEEPMQPVETYSQIASMRVRMHTKIYLLSC